jgi:hypothetical protein
MLDLEDFVDISATSPVKNREDIMLYYRRFLQISNPLYNSEELTDERRNAEFFEGFHIKDRTFLPTASISRRLALRLPLPDFKFFSATTLTAFKVLI